MGAVIAPFTDNSTDTKPQQQKTSKEKKADAKARVDKWQKVVDEFKSQLLDPSYLALPVRGSTVEAATQYPASPNSKQPGLMPGTHKHLGGAYDPTDGCIYGVPASSKSVLCLYPINAKGEKVKGDGTDEDPTVVDYRMTTIPLPESIAKVQYKFLRGIFAHGYLWAIPSWANSVLCVDVDAFWGRRKSPPGEDIVNLIPLPEDHKPIDPHWQWHGAGINNEKTAIFCVPSNARQVLKVDLQTKKTSLIPIDGFDPADYPNFSIDTTNKWYGGIVGADNCVYCVPYRTCAVLRIDCEKETATLVGPDYGNTKYNWHGGIQRHGKIYAHPSHADTVLVINTNPGTDPKDICKELPIDRAEYDSDTTQNYKWLGGCVGVDGNIYCPACDTSSVLRIDVTTEKCTTFGFAGTLKNKWQGGILGRDGCVYCIPASGHHVCRIATDPNIEGEKPVQLIGDLSVHKDKWQGGHQGKDGSLYFIPENGYRVMKVTPPEKLELVDGKLKDNDYTVELL